MPTPKEEELLMHKRAFSVVSLEKSVSTKVCKVLSVELDSKRLRICFLAAEWATSLLGHV